MHQGLIAKAVCEYVPEAQRENFCDLVVREMSQREVSVRVEAIECSRSDWKLWGYWLVGSASSSVY